MLITVTHETRYVYEGPAQNVLQILRMTPRDHAGQHVLRWRVEPSVEGKITAGLDHFGNAVHVFAPDGPLRGMALRAEGKVETTDTAGTVRGAAERLHELCFLRETPLTAASEEIRSFAEGVSSPATLDTLHNLLLAVHETVLFDVQGTDSGTAAAEAFARRRGVCQDLTHVFLAAARHLGIPSRYVSGYFWRADGVVEQAAGHAWAEALVPDLGWVGFDPANGISVTDAHVRVAIGLDYLGAAPVRGSRRGGGAESLSVRVRVDRSGLSQSQAQQAGGGASWMQTQG